MRSAGHVEDGRVEHTMDHVVMAFRIDSASMLILVNYLLHQTGWVAQRFGLAQ
jgi:hypothetical protein